MAARLARGIVLEDKELIDDDVKNAMTSHLLDPDDLEVKEILYDRPQEAEDVRHRIAVRRWRSGEVSPAKDAENENELEEEHDPLNTRKIGQEN